VSRGPEEEWGGEEEGLLRMRPVGMIESPFPSKFGIPRQPGLAASVPCVLRLNSPYDTADFTRGLEAFSHVWLIWRAHLNPKVEAPAPLVRPPRLGGNKRVGVFASRSVFRPNSIGLSVVKLQGVVKVEGRVHLRLEGADIANGTPVYDVKPYLPYADIVPNAVGGFAPKAPVATLQVEFSKEAEKNCVSEAWRKQLVQVLAQDPRPAYHNDPSRLYSLRYSIAEITFRVAENVLRVENVTRLVEFSSCGSIR